MGSRSISLGDLFTHKRIAAIFIFLRDFSVYLRILVELTVKVSLARKPAENKIINPFFTDLLRWQWFTAFWAS